MKLKLDVKSSTETKAQKSESRGKKKKKGNNLRSQMLRMIMPMLSREQGEKLANAIDQKNTKVVASVMDQIKRDLVQKVAEK